LVLIMRERTVVMILGSKVCLVVIAIPAVCGLKGLLKPA